LNEYDYGARFYDPALGRFLCSDPIADEFPWVSPYNYAENSPISNIDLYGLQAVAIIYGVAVGVEELVALTTSYILARQGTKAIRDHVENNTNEGIKGTNKKQNHLEGTSTSRGNPPNNGSSGQGKPDNPLENLDGAIGTTVGLLVGTALSSSDHEPVNKVTDYATGEEVSEMEEAIGEHLSDSEPDYWNNDLTDAQREGYNQQYQAQWQQYLHNKKNEDEEPEDQ